MIYELRVYHCVPGRLPDLVKRFDTLTLPLWKKHGIQQAGFWTVAIGPSNQDLYYMLKWESLDDRAKRFAGFQADPEWVAGRAETEKNGPIVASITNTILQPTSFLVGEDNGGSTCSTNCAFITACRAACRIC